MGITLLRIARNYWIDWEYPDVLDVLNELHPRYNLEAISDAQSAWCPKIADSPLRTGRTPARPAYG